MGDGIEAKRGRQGPGRKRDHSYDEVFKALGKQTMENYFDVVSTDHELLYSSKRVDLFLSNPKAPIEGSFTILRHFKDFNLIEFKSEKDSFRGDMHLGKIYCYYGGLLLDGKGAFSCSLGSGRVISGRFCLRF